MTSTGIDPCQIYEGDRKCLYILKERIQLLQNKPLWVMGYCGDIVSEQKAQQLIAQRKKEQEEYQAKLKSQHGSDVAAAIAAVGNTITHNAPTFTPTPHQLQQQKAIEHKNYLEKKLPRMQKQCQERKVRQAHSVSATRQARVNLQKLQPSRKRATRQQQQIKMLAIGGTGLFLIWLVILTR